MNARAQYSYGPIIVNFSHNDEKLLMRQKTGCILKKIYKRDISHFTTFHIGKDIWQRETLVTLVIDIQIQDLFWQILFSTSKVFDSFDSSSEFLLMSITLLGQALTNCSPPTNRDKLSGPTREVQQTGFRKGRDISQGLGETTSFQCCSFHHWNCFCLWVCHCLCICLKFCLWLGWMSSLKSCSFHHWNCAAPCIAMAFQHLQSKLALRSIINIQLISKIVKRISELFCHLSSFWWNSLTVS